jgi:hypothetical protein
MPSRADTPAVMLSLPTIVQAVCEPWKLAPAWSPKSIRGLFEPRL